MLVLSRKVGEEIAIGDGIKVVVRRISKGRVSLAIQAPQEIPVLRGELAPFGIDDKSGEDDAEPEEPRAEKRRSPRFRSGPNPTKQPGESNPGNTALQTPPIFRATSSS